MELLNKIQQELQVPKTHFNQFGDFWYRKEEDIQKAVKPLLAGATLVVSDKMVLIGDRYYVEATATLKLGDEVEFATAYAREPESKKKMDEAQLTGLASSYARKYALGGLFGLDNGRDVDAIKPEPEKKEKTVEQPDPIPRLRTELKKKHDITMEAKDIKEFLKGVGINNKEKIRKTGIEKVLTIIVEGNK